MSFYQLLCSFVSVLVFFLLQLANAQRSKYLLDRYFCYYYDFFCLKTQLNNRFWTHFVHLINLILNFKWVLEKGIENILLDPLFKPFFLKLGLAKGNAGTA